MISLAAIWRWLNRALSPFSLFLSLSPSFSLSPNISFSLTQFLSLSFSPSLPLSLFLSFSLSRLLFVFIPLFLSLPTSLSPPLSLFLSLLTSLSPYLSLSPDISLSPSFSLSLYLDNSFSLFFSLTLPRVCIVRGTGRARVHGAGRARERAGHEQGMCVGCTSTHVAQSGLARPMRLQGVSTLSPLLFLSFPLSPWLASDPRKNGCPSPLSHPIAARRWPKKKKESSLCLWFRAHRKGSCPSHRRSFSLSPSHHHLPMAPKEQWLLSLHPPPSHRLSPAAKKKNRCLLSRPSPCCSLVARKKKQETVLVPSLPYPLLLTGGSRNRQKKRKWNLLPWGGGALMVMKVGDGKGSDDEGFDGGREGGGNTNHQEGK